MVLRYVAALVSSGYAVHSNNADLGKGLPWRHGNMVQGKSSFFGAPGRGTEIDPCVDPFVIPVSNPVRCRLSGLCAKVQFAGSVQPFLSNQISSWRVIIGQECAGHLWATQARCPAFASRRPSGGWMSASGTFGHRQTPQRNQHQQRHRCLWDAQLRLRTRREK
jgi:hypothetical protein